MRATHAQNYSLSKHVSCGTHAAPRTRQPAGNAPARSVDGLILPWGLALGLEASEWRSRRQGLFATVEPDTEKDPGGSTNNNVMMEMRQKECRCWDDEKA